MSTCRYDCSDGLIFETVDGYESMFRCPCPLGERYAGPLFRPGDRKRERPYTIAVYRGQPRGTPVGREKAQGND